MVNKTGNQLLVENYMFRIDPNLICKLDWDQKKNFRKKITIRVTKLNNNVDGKIVNESEKFSKKLDFTSSHGLYFVPPETLLARLLCVLISKLVLEIYRETHSVINSVRSCCSEL